MGCVACARETSEFALSESRLRHRIAAPVTPQSPRFVRIMPSRTAPLFKFPYAWISAREYRLDRHRLFVLSITTLLFIISASRRFARADSSLAVIEAGIQQAEDAPFIPPSYHFLPGDFVYLTFEIAGFSVKTDRSTDTRHISLTYEIEPQDADDVALVAPIKGTIEADLNPEDKNWTPKRRASFLLPSYIAAGNFHVRIVGRDFVGKSEASKDLPFLIGGIEVPHTYSLTAQNFAFVRKEGDRDALEVAAYAPGDTVFARFNMIGFKLGKGNRYELSYGVTVLRPDGKPLLQDPHAAELKDDTFYPARYLPGSIAITTPSNAPKGQYVFTLTIHDLIGNRTSEIKQSFSIE